METPDVNGVKFGETSARDGGGNPELSLGSVLAPVGWSECVAIWTEKAKIDQMIIFVISVDVIKL